MSKQLFFEGFPQPLHREAYTTPKTVPTELPARKLWEPFEQMISINPEYFTLFNDLSSIRGKRRILPALFPQTVQRIINQGTMSRSACTRMKRAINYLSLISKPKRVHNIAKDYEFTFKLSFITLTLSDDQKHSDNFIKTKLLKNFIDSLRKRYPALSYVWKAETQNNGRLHFHIITDHFIPTSYINNRWNKIQWNYGYLSKYMSKNGHMRAPSAEIRKVKGDKELARYMRKYMIKGIEKISPAEIHSKIDSLKNRIAFSDSTLDRDKVAQELTALYRKLNELKKRKVLGKIWGCSDNLGLPPYKTNVDSLSVEDRQLLFENPVIVDSPYFQVFKLPNFRKFISEFSNYSKSFIVNHYKKLIHPIKIPDLIYSTDSNYSYS